MVKYKTIESKSILNISKYIDDWFCSKAGMNLYRGCIHACEYCDGRNEKYQTHKDFGETVYIKMKAPFILKKEIKKIKEKTIIGLGGGVGDSYQKCEEKFKLTRQALEIIKNQEYQTIDMEKRSNISCEILTKSVLVERDIDLIKKINGQSRAIVMFSISSMDNEVCKIFEPRTSPPKDRLNILKKISENLIPTGVMLLPLIPYISDDEDSIKDSVKKIKKAGTKFILFGGMTLKEGHQKENYFNTITKRFPELVNKYKHLYKKSGKYGNPKSSYNNEINKLAYQICKENKMETRIPYEFFRDKIELKDEVSLILAHISHYSRMEGKEYYIFKKASFNIQKCPDSIEKIIAEKRLNKIPGLNKFINEIVEEIVIERKCDFYENLRKNW